MGAATSFLSPGPAYTPGQASQSFTFGEAVPGSRGGTTTSLQFGITPYKGYTIADIRSGMTQGQLQAAVEQYLLFFSSPLISGCFGSCDVEKLDKLAQLGITPTSSSLEKFQEQPTNSAIVKVASNVMKKIGGGKGTKKRRGKGRKGKSKRK
jgi:hypothetical protein